jgi:hypothetical protein
MRHIGDRLMWKGEWIEDVGDAELATARDYTHRLFHQLMDSPPFTRSGIEWADNVAAQLCAVEAECMRRGQSYRDAFAFREFG